MERTRQYGTRGKVARANIQDPNSSSVEKCRQENSEAMGGLFIALTNANCSKKENWCVHVEDVSYMHSKARQSIMGSLTAIMSRTYKADDASLDTKCKTTWYTSEVTAS